MSSNVSAKKRPVCAVAEQKDGEALRNHCRFDTRFNIHCDRVTACVSNRSLQVAGNFVTPPSTLLLPSSMAALHSVAKCAQQRGFVEAQRLKGEQLLLEKEPLWIGTELCICTLKSIQL